MPIPPHCPTAPPLPARAAAAEVSLALLAARRPGLSSSEPASHVNLRSVRSRARRRWALVVCKSRPSKADLRAQSCLDAHHGSTPIQRHGPPTVGAVLRSSPTMASAAKGSAKGRHAFSAPRRSGLLWECKCGSLSPDSCPQCQTCRPDSHPSDDRCAVRWPGCPGPPQLL